VRLGSAAATSIVRVHPSPLYISISVYMCTRSCVISASFHDASTNGGLPSLFPVVARYMPLWHTHTHTIRENGLSAVDTCIQYLFNDNNRRRRSQNCFRGYADISKPGKSTGYTCWTILHRERPYVVRNNPCVNTGFSIKDWTANSGRVNIDETVTYIFHLDVFVEIH